MTEDSQNSSLPDIRDGLTAKERIVLMCLHNLQREMGDRHLSTGMLYGRVLEHINLSETELQRILKRLS